MKVNLSKTHWLSEAGQKLLSWTEEKCQCFVWTMVNGHPLFLLLLMCHLQPVRYQEENQYDGRGRPRLWAVVRIVYKDCTNVNSWSVVGLW